MTSPSTKTRYIACTTPDPDLSEGGILPRSSWPTTHPTLKGVFVGGCVVKGKGSKFHGKAHAHYGEGEWTGWICFASIKWLHVRELWLHEVAHIVAQTSHGPAWRNAVRRLGGTLKRVPGVMRSYLPKKK